MTKSTQSDEINFFLKVGPDRVNNRFKRTGRKYRLQEQQQQHESMESFYFTEKKNQFCITL